MQITTTSVKQTANEILGTPERTLYYLIIQNKNGEKLIINVGEKTHKGVIALHQQETTKQTK